MRTVYHPDAVLHEPPRFLVRGEPRPVPEKPERAQAIVELLRARGLAPDLPPDYGPGPRAAVHSRDYLAFLETAFERWSRLEDASPAVIPNVFRGPGMESYPRDVVGQAGFHLSDTACPIAAGTWRATAWSANSAVHAARLVATGAEDTAYAVCRPPGHHASRDRAGGFCFLNHAAIAAQECLSLLTARGQRPRVAILDVDVHHGNGTQEIFYDRDDVLFASVHADPDGFYPFLAGHAHERGAGRGLGYTLNRPLPLGTDEATFLAETEAICAEIGRFGPEILILSLGFDTYVHDPLAAFGVTTPGFARLARILRAMRLPTVIIQEGGYAIDALNANLGSFLDGWTTPDGETA